MILPQLEQNSHVVDVAGMFLTITFCLKRRSVGERLSRVLMKKCYRTSVVRRGFADGTLEQCGSGDVAKGLVDSVVFVFHNYALLLNQIRESSNYSLKIQKIIK